MPTNILPELSARGLVADVTSAGALGEALAAGNVPHYAGHDPTASSLHIGHLVPLVVQKRLQLAGHRPIVVVGGATGMIGDPSGKSAERNLLDAETIAHNMAGMRTQLGRLLEFDGAAGAMMTNNADWFSGMGFVEFLRDVGKHMTVNYMLAKDSVKSRIEDRDVGISFTEFSYMLLQAWDFVHLSRAYGCLLQIGGSDQWGNITAGCELSRKLGGPQLFGLTAPLLLDRSGQKMGKTSTGERVWLDPARTSAYAFYQYWLNVDDGSAINFLRMFSFRPLQEIAEIESAHVFDPAKRLGQRTLGEDLTRWIHGDAAIARVQKASAVMFGGSLEGLGDDDLGELASEVGESTVTEAQLQAGIPLIDALVLARLATSKSEARRLISGGGVYVNNQRIAQLEFAVGNSERGTPSFVFLRAGKKNYRLLRIVAG